MLDILKESKSWSVFSFLTWATKRLGERNIDSPRRTVELLLCHVLHYETSQLYARFDRPLSLSEITTLTSLLERRLSHEPLQYILGEAEFMGLPFAVDKRVLIPRPETELLVEQTLQIAKMLGPKETIRVLDIGTGSGNIAIGIAHFLTNADVLAIDASAAALQVAQLNAERLNVRERIRFMNVDIFDSVESLAGERFDFVVSNPPYVSQEEFEQLQPEVKDFEPRRATVDSGDGLRFFRRISQIARDLLKKDGWLVVETGYNQATDVVNILSQSGFKKGESVRDYGGNERVVKAQWSS